MSAVSSLSLRMAGAGLVLRVWGCVSSLQVLWPAAAQGPGGLPTRRTRVLRRALKTSCRVCRLGLRLSAYGGLQLLAQCQRPDLVDHEDGAQVGRSGGLCSPFRDGLQLLPAVEVEPPRR